MVRPEATTERPPLEAVAVLKTRLVGARARRVSIEWVLNSQPAPAWIGAFEEAIAVHEPGRSMVDSAYGRPLVMPDETIVWSVIDTEMRSAVLAVESAVLSANSSLDSALGRM
jgi:hypothetical protein